MKRQQPRNYDFGLTPEYCGKRPPDWDESYEKENPWNRTISTVLWVHKKLPQSTVKLVLPSNESYVIAAMRAKRVVTVPLHPYFGFHWDFWTFQFNLLGSQGGNSCEMMTSPPGHHWEATVALTTAAKLQQFRANSRAMTSQKLNNRCGRSMRPIVPGFDQLYPGNCRN